MKAAYCILAKVLIAYHRTLVYGNKDETFEYDTFILPDEDTVTTLKIPTDQTFPWGKDESFEYPYRPN